MTTQFKYTIFTYVENKTRGTTMATIKEFHEKLLVAFGKANKIILDRLHGEIRGNELVVTVRREKQGLCNCINASILSVHPGNKKHQMEIEEIMVGYDSEGSDWSDHMGGRIVDCTGLNVEGAIEKIVAEMNERV